MQLTSEARSRGYYIVIEGDEGSGKTTQVPRLQDRLEAVGISSQYVREPGGDPLGEALRTILKHADYPITAHAELALFSAARANSLELVVKPLLEKGIWVISDRSKLTTFAIQGYGRGLMSGSTQEQDRFLAVIDYFARTVRDDITVTLAVPYDVAQARLEARRASQGNTIYDRFDDETPEMRQRINQAYNLKFDDRHFMVDGVGSEAEVEQRVWELVVSWANWRGLTVASQAPGFRETGSISTASQPLY